MNQRHLFLKETHSTTPTRDTRPWGFLRCPRIGFLLLCFIHSAIAVTTAPSLAQSEKPCRIHQNGTTQTRPNGSRQHYQAISGLKGGSIQLDHCHYYIIENNHFQGDVRGIYVTQSQNIIIRNNRVENVGQEAIAIKPGSRDIHILHNTIHNTGLHGIDDPKKQDYAEGIYIGDGKNPGPVHNVRIKGNRISGTRAEGIEIKPRVTAAIIEENLISDGGASHGGAIAIGAYNANHFPNPRHIIRNNVIENYQAYPDRKHGKTEPYIWVAGGIWVNTGAEIYGNTIRNVHSCGILLSRNLAPSQRDRIHIHRNSVAGKRAPICKGYGQTDVSGDAILSDDAMTAKTLRHIADAVKRNAGQHKKLSLN